MKGLPFGNKGYTKGVPGTWKGKGLDLTSGRVLTLNLRLNKRKCANSYSSRKKLNKLNDFALFRYLWDASDLLGRGRVLDRGV